MYRVRLTKIQSNHTNLRTDVIEGETEKLPKKGGSFQMSSKGLEYGIRVVTTTEIQFVEKMDDNYRFNTLNSIYQLEVLGDA